MPEQDSQESYNFSLKGLFTPLTTLKAIHWIVIIGFIVFANMLFNGFVWDDEVYILYDPEVQTLNVPAIIGQSSFNADGQYRPFTALYFMILFSLFNTSTFFYHVLQLIIHIVNAILVFVLFRRFINKYAALLSSLIFLVHPIQVESASYIASSDNPLFFLFGMIALLLSMKETLSIRRIIIIFSLLLLSLLTKESGFLFLVMILFYIVFLRKKYKWIFIACGATVTLLYFFIRLGIGKIFFSSTEVLTPFAHLTLSERLLNIPAIIFYYLKTIVFPMQLAVDQKWIVISMNLTSFYLPLFVVVVFFFCLCLLGWAIYRVDRGDFYAFIFFFIWFSVGLILHLQIFPLDMTVADRWFYFPFVGLLGMIALGISSLKHYKRLLAAGFVIGIISLLFLSIRTVVRNTNWHDPISLYSHDITLNDNADLESNLGFEYGLNGNYKEDLRHSLRAINLSPTGSSYYNAGYSYERMGNLAKAREYYSLALTTENYAPQNGKRSIQVYAKEATMLILTNEFENAKTFITTGLHDYPDSIQLWFLLAISEYKLRNHNEALSAAKKAEELYPATETQSLYAMISNKQPMELSLKSFPIAWINQ